MQGLLGKEYLLRDDLREVVEGEGPLERRFPPVACARGGRLSVAERLQRELLLQLIEPLKCVMCFFPLFLQHQIYSTE